MKGAGTMNAYRKIMSVSELLEAAASEAPDQEAVYDSSRRLTYGELQQEVDRLARALVASGVQKGDRVGVSLPNWHETVELFFAIAKAGAILVPFNPKYRLHEAHHIVMNSGVKILFVCSEFENVGFDSFKPYLQQIVTVRYEKEGYSSFSTFVQKQEASIPAGTVESDSDEVYCMLYTSGTTGTPKGVLITHRSVVQSGMAIADSMRCASNDVFLVIAPIFHIFGMACNLMSAVHCRARMVLMEKFKPQEALRLIEQEKVTIHHAVPSMLNLEMKSPDFDSYDLSSLRAGMTGAAPCSPDVIEGVRTKMGMKLCISFGTTETGSVTITEYDEEEQLLLETVGKAIEGVEVRIVDDNKMTLPPGSTGEIACRGFGVMKGYYNMPEQTEAALDDEGWYYTGDLGVMDEKGYIRYAGRMKELIIRGGYNIYPQEIEGLLQNHAKVLESAIVGLPDKVLGEIVCAVIRLKPGMTSNQDEIIEYLKAHIAIYKVPQKVVFVNELPITASGKVQKNKLREEIMGMGGTP